MITHYPKGLILEHVNEHSLQGRLNNHCQVAVSSRSMRLGPEFSALQKDLQAVTGREMSQSNARDIAFKLLAPVSYLQETKDHTQQNWGS